jgi:alkylated DNA nucleotide flippase Atl1
VVAAGGRLGGYAGNPMLKRSLLASEGVLFKGGRIRLDAYRVKSRMGTAGRRRVRNLKSEV